MTVSSAAGPARLTLLDWDRAVLGVGVARVVGSTLDPVELAAIEADCRRSRIQLLYFLCDAGHRPSIRLAEASGFRLVDLRVELECRRAGSEFRADPFCDRPGRVEVRRAVPDDAAPILRLTRGAFADSRFYFDERIPLGAADRLYDRWVRRYLDDGLGVLHVADTGTQALGFVATHLEARGTGRIGLVATAPAFRGRGVGRALIDAALDWAWGAGCRRVEVVTHGRSVAAQRMYHRAGFVQTGSGIWYHRWFDR